MKLHTIVQDEVKDPAGHRPGLLIAHGLYGSARNWGSIARALADSRRVVTVDMRNHGDSPWAPAHGYEEMAADLAQAIADHGAGQPMDLLGHSMGGKAAMVCALLHPDRVARLVVADIAPVEYGHSHLPYIRAMQGLDLSRLSRRSEAEAALAAALDTPELAPFLIQSLDMERRRWRLNLDVLADQMPRILGFPDLGDAVYRGPVLFLSGAASDYVQDSHRPEILRRFPGARFAKIPGAGHFLHAQKPHEVTAGLRHWLDIAARADR